MMVLLLKQVHLQNDAGANGRWGLVSQLNRVSYGVDLVQEVQRR